MRIEKLQRVQVQDGSGLEEGNEDEGKKMKRKRKRKKGNIEG